MENPVPSVVSSVPLHWFVGRRDLLKEIEEETLRQRIFFVVGIRGQGKTSVFDKLKQDIANEQTCVIPLEIAEDESHGESLSNHRYKVVSAMWDFFVESGGIQEGERKADQMRRKWEEMKQLPDDMPSFPKYIRLLVMFLLNRVSTPIPDTPDAFFRRLLSSLKPQISRVVILIDEADLEVTQCRSIAKAVTQLSRVPNSPITHAVFFSKPHNLARFSNSDFGPRSPRELQLTDFDILEIEQLVRKVTSASSLDGDSDRAIAELVHLETGGVPNVTMPFLHQLWETWARRSGHKRGIDLSDVRETAVSPKGYLIDALQSIVRGVKNATSKNPAQYKALLHRLASEDEAFTSPMSHDVFADTLLHMTDNLGGSTKIVDEVTSALISHNVVITTDSGELYFRGRLLRRQLNPSS